MTVDGSRQLTTGPSLADQAYHVLREMITSGDLAPSERLTERGLATRLGVSPTPVREAISRLIHERLLTRLDGRNLRVASASIRRLREMVLIHAALSGVAARLAAEHATDAELEAIAAAHEASLVSDRPPEPDVHEPGGPQLRHHFHELIVEASHNLSLIDMIATAEAFGRPLRNQAQGAAGAAESIQQAVDEHEGIVAALLARDGERAERLVREHARWVGERYIAYAEENGLL